MNTVFNHEHLDRELEAVTRGFCSEKKQNTDVRTCR